MRINLSVLHQKLTDALSPVTLAIRDDSARHKGHAGYREGEITHIYLYIVSQAFNGKNRIERHRMVYHVLKNELSESSLHSLSLKALTPQEVSPEQG